MNHVTVSSAPTKITLRYGQKGDRGIGIASVALDDSAHLIITYTDGKTEDAGAVLGDVNAVKDYIKKYYDEIVSDKDAITKLAEQVKTNADKAQDALDKTQDAASSGINSINTLVTEKTTFLTNTFNQLNQQAKANIDQWERDAEEAIHKAREFSLDKIHTAYADAMVDIERSVNKAEAWAVSETSPDKEPDFESPTGLTQSSRTWAIYSKNKVQEAVDTLSSINQTKRDVEQMKADTSDLLNKTKLAEANATDYANQAHDSMVAAKKSETNANDYMESAKSDAVLVNKSITEAKNIANNLQAQLDNLDNPPKEITGEPKGALHILYLDNTTKDITLAQMGADTSKQVTDKVNEGVSTANLYTDSKIAGLVGGAPEALDTLKELADALGNDANIAATVTKKIGDVSDKLNQEIQDRKDADTNAANNVASQVNELQKTDQDLSDRLDTEVQNRETGDNDTYTKATTFTEDRVVANNATLTQYIDKLVANAATDDDIDLIFATKG